MNAPDTIIVGKLFARSPEFAGVIQALTTYHQ
jgi:hypothetical protein